MLYEPEVDSGFYKRRPVLSITPTKFSKSLCTGDIILSRKKSTDLLGKIGNWGIRAYQKNLFPQFPEIWDYNHVRLVLGRFRPVDAIYSDGIVLVFEWTSPQAKISVFQPWMSNPDYATIFRNEVIHTRSIANSDLTEKMLTQAFSESFKLYDYLQLIGIALTKKWIQLGEKYEVCSTGARKMIESCFNIDSLFDMECWKTPPCIWAASKDWKVFSIKDITEEEKCGK